jgi:hypothetical protein
MHALIAVTLVVTLVLMITIVWYGLALRNRVPVAGSAPEPSVERAPGKPGTWTLWQVSEMYKNNEVSDGPDSKGELPVELDLDRAACELVLQTKVRGTQQRAAQHTDGHLNSDNGASWYHLGNGAEKAVHFSEHFYCVAVPGFPPGHVPRSG